MLLTYATLLLLIAYGGGGSVMVSAIEVSSDLAFLDLYEMDHVKYAVVIDGKPVKIKAEASKDLLTERPLTDPTHSILPMTNKFGQKYHCLLPDISDLAEQESSRREKQESLPLETFATQVKTLLSAMARDPCLIRTKDWWTYELCPGSIVKQYHMEEGKPQGKTLILGHFNHDHQWTEEDRKRNQMYHSQYYANGSECDLTGNLRKTEVKYHCEPTAIYDSITEVHEPLSCEYVVHVSTNKICSIPELKPAPPNTPKEIKCHPALSPRDYEQYEIFEREREKEMEKKLKDSREQQRRTMLKFIGGDIPKDVDIDSEDGLRYLEDLVEQKLADSVVNKLNTLIDDVFASGGTIRGSGGPQSKPKNKKTEFLDMVEQIGRIKHFKRLLPKADESTKHKGKEEEKFDLEAERKVRSEVVTEGEMIDELKSTFSQLKEEKQAELSNLKESKEFQENLQESLAEIVRESEQELGTKLDPSKKNELDSFAETIKDLIRKVDHAESEIKRVNAEIEKVQGIIDGQDYDYREDYPYEGEDPYGNYGEERLHYKHDNKLSVKKELREEDYDESFFEGQRDHQTDGTLNVVIKELPGAQVEGLESEARIAKRVESIVRSKLSKASGGLEVGGRQVQIKVVTFNVDDPEVAEGLASAAAGKGEGGTGATAGTESQQFQDMIYNLMIGNQQAYDDIDGQRKSERNYKFQWDDKVLSEETSSKSTAADDEQSPNGDS